MPKNVLPDQFRELEVFAPAWTLATETERNRKRLSSPMEELQAFYDVMLPRIEAIFEYLNQFPLDKMPENARKLFYLALSFAEIALAVELFKQPSVVDGFEPDRFVAVKVPHMTPKDL